MNKNTTNDSVLKWVDSNGMVNSAGKPFEWFYHSFLLEPLCDFHPRQGVNKSAQVGWSETMVLKAMFMAKEKKYNIIYTLPTDQFLQRFVTPKVDPIIENNYILNTNVQGGVTLKQIGKGKDQRYIYFMGAFNSQSSGNKELSSKGVSVTADLLIHDEASRSDQFILNQMISRTENSEYKGRWLFDNPSTPGKGADSIYKISDQKHWFITCSRCGHKQYLDWARLDKHNFKKGSIHAYVDTEKKEFICGKCAKPIRNQDRITGEWVAKYPSKGDDYRGYWLSQLCYVQHNVEDILLKDESPTYPKSQFFNYVLGKPYIGSDVRVSRSNIIANMNGEVNKLQGNAMGIDQGKVKWYCIGNHEGLIKVGYTESWEEIEFLFNKYECKAVCDALPYQAEPKRLATKYPGRFFRAFYKPESDQSELAKFSPKNDRGVVLIRRNEMFDELANKIVKGNYPIQATIEELEDLISHWENIVRVVDEDTHGNERFKWERISDDHLAHASLYMEVAKQKTTVNDVTVMKMVEPEIKITPSVDTRKPIFGENLYDSFTKR